jgi:hypothetical protein
MSAVLARLLIVPLTLPAHALTCAQQAQVRARSAKQKGQPEYAPKCLALGRVAEYRSGPERRFAISGQRGLQGAVRPKGSRAAASPVIASESEAIQTPGSPALEGLDCFVRNGSSQ